MPSPSAIELTGCRHRRPHGVRGRRRRLARPERTAAPRRRSAAAVGACAPPYAAAARAAGTATPARLHVPLRTHSTRSARPAPPQHLGGALHRAPWLHCHHRLPQGNGLGCAGVEALVQALRRPGCAQQLRYLGLAANGIGEAGGCSLAGWLGEPGVPLQTIELRDNRLGDRAASALAAMLCRNRQPRPQGGGAALGSGAARPAVPPQRAPAGSGQLRGQLGTLRGTPGTLVTLGAERSTTQPAALCTPACTQACTQACTPACIQARNSRVPGCSTCRYAYPSPQPQPQPQQAAAPVAPAQRHRRGGRAQPYA